MVVMTRPLEFYILRMICEFTAKAGMTIKEIKSIELVLENCEVIVVEKESIGTMNLTNIHRSIRRVATNSVSDLLQAEEVFIQISSKVNHVSSYSLSLGSGTPFERLMQYGDITAVLINYEDGSEEYIFVDWSEGCEYNNLYQSSAVNEQTGDLYLVISPKETVESFFGSLLTE